MYILPTYARHCLVGYDAAVAEVNMAVIADALPPVTLAAV